MAKSITDLQKTALRTQCNILGRMPEDFAFYGSRGRTTSISDLTYSEAKQAIDYLNDATKKQEK